MEITELRKIIQDAGIAGAGGAGFPTYMKLDKKVNTIILNCAECEPLLKVHRQLLEKKTFEILKAMELVANTLEATEIIIAIKNSYQNAIKSLKASFEELNLTKIKIGLLPEIYPAGDEVVTIYETTGKVVSPGNIPLEIGVAVFNVETMYNIYMAAFEAKPVTMKYLTISGEVKNPVTICMPIGSTVREALKLAGGVSINDPCYINGGPMTGKIVSENDRITKTTNAILVFSKTHSLIMKKTRNTSIDMKRAMAACCQCRMCTDMCPRNLLGHPIEPHNFMRAATTGTVQDITPFLNTFFCSQCGICEMYACDQNLAPKSLIDIYRAGLRAKGVTPPKNIEKDSINDMREYRAVPMKRLIARLGIDKYNVEAPMSESVISPDKVFISLNQHIGAPAVPIVKIGQHVSKGEIIAKASEGNLSIPYHSSIDGIIIEFNDKFVIIKSI